MRTKTNTNMLSLLHKPLCIAFLLFGLFGLIWLRSSVTTVAYDLRNLEEKKNEALRNEKILLAERAKLMSLEKLDVSYRTNAHDEGGYADYVFPDRTRVIHVTENRGPQVYQASFSAGSRNRLP
jgi:hypothetical protein